MTGSPYRVEGDVLLLIMGESINVYMRHAYKKIRIARNDLSSGAQAYSVQGTSVGDEECQKKPRGLELRIYPDDLPVILRWICGSPQPPHEIVFIEDPIARNTAWDAWQAENRQNGR